MQIRNSHAKRVLVCRHTTEAMMLTIHVVPLLEKYLLMQIFVKTAMGKKFLNVECAIFL